MTEPHHARIPSQLRNGLEPTVPSVSGWQEMIDKLVGHPGATTPWPEKAEEELLQRLVDLNQQRAAEEAQGKTRHLRPDSQAPEESATQGELATDQAEAPDSPRPGPDPGPLKKLPWPKTLQAQIRSVRDQLATTPMDTQALASHYKRKPEKSIFQALEALTELGMVRRSKDNTFSLNTR